MCMQAGNDLYFNSNTVGYTERRITSGNCLNMDATKTLLERKHKTPLQLAIHSKNVERIFSLLSETQDVHVRGDDGSTALHELICSCLYRDVQYNSMFSKAVTPTAVSTQDNDGNSPLHLAIKTAHYHLVPLLVNVGADVNMQNTKGETPLHILCTDTSTIVALYFSVLHHLVSRNNINMQDSKGNTPLHVALKHDNCQLACYLRRQYKPDLSICDSSQRTVLHLVLWKLHINPIFTAATATSVIKLFMSPDSLNLQDIEGNAPIHISFKNKCSSDSLVKKRGVDLSTPLETLITLENINLQDRYGNSPLHLALKGKHFDDAKFLLQHSPDTTLLNREQMTALHVACYVNAPLELVQKIISKENANIKDIRGNTALVYAVKSESLLPLVFQYDLEINYKDISLAEREKLAEAIIHSDFCSDALHKSAREYVLPMIIFRANCTDARGRTALHHLVLTNNNAFLMDVAQSEMVGKDICDNESKTPLHYAMIGRKTFDEDLIDALITPTNVNIRNWHDYTPLHCMISKYPKRLFRYLEGNNVSEIGKRIMTKLITKENINLKNNINMTLLRFVVRHKRWDLIPSVLERGADVCSLFRCRQLQHAVKKYTILHDAIEHHVPADTFKLIISHENTKLNCSTNILCCAVSHQRWDLMQLLLDYGADINAPNQEMWDKHTALHRAIQARNAPLEIVSQLISPENISMETSSGETAKTLAVQTGQWHVLKLLLSHGYRETGPLSLLCGLTIKQTVPEEVSKRCLPPKMWKDIEALGEYLGSVSFSNAK